MSFCASVSQIIFADADGTFAAASATCRSSSVRPLAWRRGPTTVPKLPPQAASAGAERHGERDEQAEAHGNERTDSRPGGGGRDAGGARPGDSVRRVRGSSSSRWPRPRRPRADRRAAWHRPRRTSARSPPRFRSVRPATIAVGVTVEDAAIPDVDDHDPGRAAARPRRHQGRMDRHAHADRPCATAAARSPRSRVSTSRSASPRRHAASFGISVDPAHGRRQGRRPHDPRRRAARAIGSSTSSSTRA